MLLDFWTSCQWLQENIALAQESSILILLFRYTKCPSNSLVAARMIVPDPEGILSRCRWVSESHKTQWSIFKIFEFYRFEELGVFGSGTISSHQPRTGVHRLGHRDVGEVGV
jgi:hypothetical protein